MSLLHRYESWPISSMCGCRFTCTKQRLRLRFRCENTGKRPFERLIDAGLVNRSLLAVHAVHMVEEEIAQFADAGVSIAHCPNSNLKLASGIANVYQIPGRWV